MNATQKNREIIEKLRNLDPNLLATILEEHNDFKVSRRIPDLGVVNYGASHGVKIYVGIYLDVETTGLDPNKDEIIEISLRKFTFDPEGNIYQFFEPFHSYQQPKNNVISEEITKITGITSDMVAGQEVDLDLLNQYITGVHLFIAHNAEFDRSFTKNLGEGVGDIFKNNRWTCSANDVPWPDMGFKSRSMENILSQLGYFYDAHRADIDTNAGLNLLMMVPHQTQEIVLHTMLKNSAKVQYKVYAINSPFDKKDNMKAAGYTWYANGNDKFWKKTVPEEDYPKELEFLKTDIYGFDAAIKVEKTTSLNRYAKPLENPDTVETIKLSLAGEAPEESQNNSLKGPSM